jgi:hypothetical protein
MKNQVHLINGDALKQQFPEEIVGKIIVVRECLVDGNVEGSSLEQLFQTRANFIKINYDGFTEQDYFTQTVSEIRKIEKISENAEINLWFEDDLFCQVNFWFTCYLIQLWNLKNRVFLVRPKTQNQFGFGGLTKPELVSIYKNKLLLTELVKIAEMWRFFQLNQLNNLHKRAKELTKKYPFILPAVKAHIQRFPKNGKLGKPGESILKIMKEIETEEFEPVFREFCKRESIYGFGDLQVKNLIREIKKSNQ